MTLPAELYARLGAALAKAYGRVPVEWALTPDEFTAVRAARDALSNVAHLDPRTAEPFLFGLPCLQAADGKPSVLVVRPRDSERREDIPV